MRKKLIISIGIIIVLAASFFFLPKFIKQNKAEKEIQAAQEAVKQLQQQQKEEYDNYQQQMTALYEKSIDDCKLIKQLNEANKCVNGIAVELRRKDYCSKIVNDDKLTKDCIDEIDYMDYSWGNDPNKCSTLSNSVMQESCFTEYFAKLQDLKECDAVTDQKRLEQCHDIVNNRLALVFDQPQACKDIKDQDMKAACEKNITDPPLDSDKDGLPNEVEISFGTDPFKADTDSDGKSDYDEINKYQTNPAGVNK